MNALSKYFLPLMLGAVVMHIIFTTYMKFYITATTVLYVIYEALLFAIFEWLRKKKILRGFVYIGISFAILFISRQLVYSGAYSTGISFIDWFYVNSQEVGDVAQYQYFVFIGIGFFITSILYYFTVYRYRVFGTMLVILFPFVIYGKRADNMTTFWLTLMLTVFLALMVHQRIITSDTKNNIKINVHYTVTILLFVTLTGALAMLVPKPEYKSRLELDSSFFDMDVTSSETAYDDLNDYSSPRYGANPTGEVLFRMRTSENEDVVYLRRQSFDVFQDNRWVNNDNFYDYDISEPDLDNEVNSPDYVYRLMKGLAQTGKYEEYGLTADLFHNDAEYSVSSWVSLSSSSYSPSYIPAPLMIHTEPLTYVERDVHGEVYYNFDVQNYRGLGASYSYIVEGQNEINYLSSLSMDWDKFLSLLSVAADNGDITYSQYLNIMEVYTNYTSVSDYSDEMKDLALQIVEGKDTEYSKAQAFVDYFENNGFVYDLEYEPDDDSIDYFLFNSKTGSCTSYATAMTLMARIAGLPARYVEGFAAYEKDDEGVFIIRDSHAHAFVEVYIAGAGWVTFDPTVPGYMQDYSQNDNNTGAFITAFVDYFSKIVLFLGAIFVLVFIILLDRIAELIFRISLVFRRTNDDKVIAVYKRIIHLLELKSNEKLKGMTPHELCSYSSKKYNADISGCIELFESVCFGGYKADDAEFKQMYQQYKTVWKQLSRKNKKKAEKRQIASK